MTASELIDKALQQAERKYNAAAAKIISQSQWQFVSEQNSQAARGSLRSGGMWKFVARNFNERLEALLQAKLDALLDAYQLYGIPLDDESERQVIESLSRLRETERQNLNNFASAQRWLAPEAITYVQAELLHAQDFLDQAKSAIEERRHLPKPPNAVSEASFENGTPLVFVSCGQSSPAERELGKAVAEMIQIHTSCAAHFAENQTNLEGVTENILKKLNCAVAFIAILHPRGNVVSPKERNESPGVRGSVWVEQEIAIAAFISQALARPMEVRCYVHQSIRREGLRDKLHLNPVLFQDDSEILKDLSLFLPSWKALGQHRRKELLSLKANISHRRVAVPGGGDDAERYMLEVNIENDGEQDATDFRLAVDFPSAFLDEGGHVLRVGSINPGMERFQITNVTRGIQHVYPGDRTESLISFHYAIRGGYEARPS